MWYRTNRGKGYSLVHLETGSRISVYLSSETQYRLALYTYHGTLANGRPDYNVETLASGDKAECEVEFEMICNALIKANELAE